MPSRRRWRRFFEIKEFLGISSFGEVGGIPFWSVYTRVVGRFLLSSWPPRMDVRMRIRRQGGVRGPSEGLKAGSLPAIVAERHPAACYTVLHRPPPTPGTGSTFTGPAPACPTTTEFNCSINHYFRDSAIATVFDDATFPLPSRFSLSFN